MTAKQIAEKLISENLVTVFSKSYCSYSTRAKSLLSSQGIAFTSIELDQVSEGSAIQNYLAEKTGQRSVPNIFIRQNHVGGCDDLMAAHSSGKLQKLVHP